MLLEVLHWTAAERADILMAFSTRQGGNSSLPVDGLNLALHVGDEQDMVLENRGKFLAALGLTLDDLVLGQQVHGHQVALVERNDAGAGARNAEEALLGVDALLTAAPGLFLAGCYADCVPLFIIDPVKPAVAMVHAGWRGTAASIARRAWRHMRDHFNSRSDQCLAYIGPSIGRCCYQAGEVVAVAMRDKWWWPQVSQRRIDGGWNVDLGLANQLQLHLDGVRAENCCLCTSCDERFYSHRRDGGHTGRMFGLVGIRKWAGNGAAARE